MCKSNTKKYVKTIEHVSEKSDSSDTENYLFGIQTDLINAVKSKQPNMMVTVNGLNTHMLVDTGANINIMDESTIQELQKTTTKAQQNNKKGIRVWLTKQFKIQWTV